MDYRLIKEEPLAEGVKRIALLLNRQGINFITEMADKNPHEAVHELRKRFKEIRGLIRLVRDAMGDQYKAENEFYRELARKITDIRDLKAFAEALTLLKIDYGDKLDQNAFSHTEAFLRQRLTQLAHEMDLRKTLEDIKSALEEHEQVIKEWKLEIQSFYDISKSLRRVYGRGYKMMHKIKNDGSADVESFHELRKRGKYMRYHMELLNFIWPVMMSAHEKEFAAFADLLGDDHDLALLLELLEREKPDEKEFQLIKAIVNDKKSMLQQQVLVLGEKLYAEWPRLFTGRIRQYWLSEEQSYTSMG